MRLTQLLVPTTWWQPCTNTQIWGALHLLYSVQVRLHSNLIGSRNIPTFPLYKTSFMYGCTAGWNEWRTAFTSIAYVQYRWQLCYFQKTGTFIFPPTAVCSFNHCYNIKHTLLNTPTSAYHLPFPQGFFLPPTLTTTDNSVNYNLIFQRITYWKWQPRISPSHDYRQNCNCNPWLSPRYKRSQII